MTAFRKLWSITGLLLLVASSCATGNTGGKPLPEFIRTGVAGQDLREPAAAIDLNDDPHVIEIDLTAEVSQYEFIAGHPSEVWTYNGQLPGPQIEAQVGDELIVHFHNELPMETMVHWHGIRLPQAMDGSHASQDPVPPGGNFEYRFTLPDAGLYWYHPHVAADDQFSRGLYGTILVRDPADPLADLPSRVLVLSDIELDSHGQVVPASEREHDEIEHSLGTIGNTLLVNGQIEAELDMQRGGRERWYLVNAAAARVFKLGLEGGSLWQVGSDGGLIEQPVEISSQVMAPGERCELVVDAPDKAASGRLLNLSYQQLFLVDSYTPEPDRGLLNLSYSGEAMPDPEPLPTQLRDFPEFAAPVQSRGFQLTAIVPGDQHSSASTLHETASGGHGDLSGVKFRINGETFPNVPIIEAKLGSVEEWRLNNHTGMDHPFHLHGFRFQLVAINDVPVESREWKDTLNLPGSVQGTDWYKVLVSLDGYPGLWPYHCHILHHQELGMMAEVRVTP